MATYAAVESFWRDWRGLSAEEQDAFYRAVEKFVHDLAAGSFRAGLRVNRVQGTGNIFELTWAGDGHATFEYGAEREPGEPHVIWRRIGGRGIFETR